MITSITLPKVKTSFGSLTGTPGSIIFKRVNIDGLSVPVTHTLHSRYAGCSTLLEDSVREGGSKIALSASSFVYLGRNVSSTTPALANTSRAGLTLYCSRISRTATASLRFSRR